MCVYKTCIGPDVEVLVQSPLYAIVIFHFTSLLLLLLLLLHLEVLLDAQVIFCCWKYTSPSWLIQQKELLNLLAWLNKVATTYYWPKMSRDIIKWYVSTCDICQKAKPRHHASARLLQPISIPSQPFEVVSMDFILELPLSNGFNNILVIVDKLTKYGIFILTTTNITEVETTALFLSTLS